LQHGLDVARIAVGNIYMCIYRFIYIYRYIYI
jgi:hypothetical protein